jgi:enolase-phosphatase E1
VTLNVRAGGFEVVLLDIEGTTTPIAFVLETLFPYARRALEPFVRDRIDRPEFAAIVPSLRRDWRNDLARGESPPEWPEHASDQQQIAAIAGYAAWLMDRDRKAFGLKELQGLIWERGYQEGALRGEVFPDVPEALRRWHASGVTIAIYSSGSALAQQLLFRSTPFGDLTPYLDAYFDTSVGAKRDPESYRRIAARLGKAPQRMLFLSDAPQELEAARAAGCRAVLCVRPGNAPAQDDESISEFGEIQ